MPLGVATWRVVTWRVYFCPLAPGGKLVLPSCLGVAGSMCFAYVACVVPGWAVVDFSVFGNVFTPVAVVASRCFAAVVCLIPGWPLVEFNRVFDSVFTPL